MAKQSCLSGVSASGTGLMRKLEKDVTITYSPVAAESKINTTFDDLVAYRKRSAADDSTPSTGSSYSACISMTRSRLIAVFMQ